MVCLEFGRLASVLVDEASIGREGLIVLGPRITLHEDVAVDLIDLGYHHAKAFLVILAIKLHAQRLVVAHQLHSRFFVDSPTSRCDDASDIDLARKLGGHLRAALYHIRQARKINQDESLLEEIGLDEEPHLGNQWPSPKTLQVLR